MKKILLCASALLASLSFTNAQTAGIGTTYAYDDFASSTPITGTNGAGIYWWKGTGDAGATDTRVAGKETFTYNNAVTTYLSADFGNDNGTKLGLDLSSMADIELDIENTSSTKPLNVRIVLEDVNGKQTQIEPNISDAAAAPDFDYVIPHLTWDDGVTPVYPHNAYNGFVLDAATRRTIRIDLSSVPGKVGGLTAGAYGSPAKPSNSPSASYDFDPSKVHAVIFILNEDTDFQLSDNAEDQGSYRFDVLGEAQNDFTGSIILRSFKIGSVLSALPATVSGVNEAAIDNSLKVYPNPAKESFAVAFNAASGAVVSLTDIIGNKVYSTSASAGENKIIMNTSALTSGVYILNIATEDGTVTRKITIK